MDNILTVYSASAGSGKTFTLAVKYIELLIEQPENYRKILAVTFTNKATDEMKLRILSQLYGLAHSLPDSQAYADKIKEDFHKAKKPISDELIKQCGQGAPLSAPQLQLFPHSNHRCFLPAGYSQHGARAKPQRQFQTLAQR